MFELLKRKIINWLQLDCDRQHIETLKHQLKYLTKEHIKLTNQLENHMAALENLSQAVTDLQNVVDATVTSLNTPHPTEAQVQSAADAVHAQVARLQAALAPTPAPAQ